MDEPPPIEYTVTVDYDQTIDQMIAACELILLGSFGGTEFLPISGHGKVEIETVLVHPPRDMGMAYATSDQVLAYMTAHGLRPATLPEMLAFEAANLDALQFPIVALGSVYLDRYFAKQVPLIQLYGKDFSLRGPGSRTIDCFAEDVIEWHESCQFLAVKITKPPA